MGGGVACLTLENPGGSGSAPVTLAVCTSVKAAGCGEGEGSHPLLVLSRDRGGPRFIPDFLCVCVMQTQIEDKRLLVPW